MRCCSKTAELLSLHRLSDAQVIADAGSQSGARFGLEAVKLC